MACEKCGQWGPTRSSFTREELIRLMEQLQCIFDGVRLVEPTAGTQMQLDDESCLTQCPHSCWTVWNKGERCSYCISRRAVTERERITKFEFLDDDLYYVIAKYVEVEGHHYSLEMISKVPDETMMEGRGRREIIEAIIRHNKRVYADPLTGAYNRRYLDEAFPGMDSDRAVAMIDADNFKEVNDTYGHSMGDRVLRGVADTIASCIRNVDAVVRYGGDEFAVIFEGMPPGMLYDKLEQIRQRMGSLTFEGAPGLRQTVSIGGVFGDGAVAELIGRADRMLYRAKEGGKNRVCVEEHE